MKKFLFSMLAVVMLVSCIAGAFAFSGSALATITPSKAHFTKVTICQKDSNTWLPVPSGYSARLYIWSFDFGNRNNPIERRCTIEIQGTATPNTNFYLIYYADPWDGSNGMLLGGCKTNAKGKIIMDARNYPIFTKGITCPTIPVPADANYPTGGKIWLVPASDYDVATHSMTAWNPSKILFDMSLVTLP
jgi:hypothetical protein